MYLEMERPYDGLLLQNCPLKVSLLPKLCGHHQSHLKHMTTSVCQETAEV